MTLIKSATIFDDLLHEICHIIKQILNLCLINGNLHLELWVLTLPSLLGLLLLLLGTFVGESLEDFVIGVG